MEDIIDLRYTLDTFYFLVMSAFVMWMRLDLLCWKQGLCMRRIQPKF